MAEMIYRRIPQLLVLKDPRFYRLSV